MKLNEPPIPTINAVLSEAVRRMGPGLIVFGSHEFVEYWREHFLSIPKGAQLQFKLTAAPHRENEDGELIELYVTKRRVSALNPRWVDAPIERVYFFGPEENGGKTNVLRLRYRRNLSQN